ncbi:hypothetical protein [Methylobacterium fujisawaense]|jgi:hypothetical protein
MFTDQPVTPARLETLIDLARHMGERRMTRETLARLVQPPSLPDVTASSEQGPLTVSAAVSLGLLVEDEGRELRLAVPPRDRRGAREILVDALDERVLGDDKVEPYLAKFYAYLIACGEEARSGDAPGRSWEARYAADVTGDEPVSNRFNHTKYGKMRRWLRYMGLGWHDARDVFQPNPYERVRRRLPLVFGLAPGERPPRRPIRLDAASFMKGLAEACPELDGGWIYASATRRVPREERTCTRALSHALVDLHLDGVIRLDCPADSLGWSLAHAEPPRDATHLRSERFDAVEWPGPGAAEDRDAA